MRDLKLKMVWEAKRSKQRKQVERQAMIDEQVNLVAAEAEATQDGSHSLFKVIKAFKSGKPRYGMNRVLFFQLRKRESLWRASPRNCSGQVLTSRWVWSRARTYPDHS